MTGLGARQGGKKLHEVRAGSALTPADVEHQRDPAVVKGHAASVKDSGDTLLGLVSHGNGERRHVSTGSCVVLFTDVFS